MLLVSELREKKAGMQLPLQLDSNDAREGRAGLFHRSRGQSTLTNEDVVN
jgi:hypothetical protein